MKSFQQGKLDSSSQNETTQFGATSTINREELKMKMMLTGSYDYLHRETGKLIQKKFYKKAFSYLEQFYHSRKDLEIAEVVQLNRRILNCINKILKTHLLKPEPEWHSEEVLVNIINRGNQAIFEIYKFLNLYIQKVLPSDANNVVLEDVSHLTSSSEDEADHIGQVKIQTLSLKINAYQKSQEKVKSTMKTSSVRIDNNLNDSSRIAEMITRSSKPLNIQFELDQLWYNSCELMIKASIIYKQSSKVKLVYFYLKEAERISDELINSQNPAVINLCARIKISLANFFLETEQYKLSLYNSQKALLYLTGEMRIRMNIEKYSSRGKKNKEKRRQKKCAKTVLSALMTMVGVYESTGQFHEMIETLTLANWIAERFVMGIDEFKKHVMKIFLEGKNRLERFLHDVADLSYIGEYTLERELKDILMTRKDEAPSKKDEQLQQFNDQMFKLFSYKKLNQEQYFLFKSQEMKQLNEKDNAPLEILGQQEKQKAKQNNNEQAKQFESQVQIHMGTDISLNILDSETNSEESFFDASFFAPSNDNLLFDSGLFEKKNNKTNKKFMKQTGNVPTRTQSAHRKLTVNQKSKSQMSLKPVGLIKIGQERQIDHKSKILTTSHYFHQFSQHSNDANKQPINKEEKYKKMLENMDFRNHPELIDNNKQDLDNYINKMVDQKIGNGGFSDYKFIQNELNKQAKKEDFDKKEFGFCRGMLKQKTKENLIRFSSKLNQKPVNIEIDTKIQNNAGIIKSKINIEKEIKELKMRKIDNLVAAQKIKQTDANLTLKDPEETSYLKKALEKNKKKQLRDLILKHKDELGLTKLYTQIMKQQKELQKQQKLLAKQQLLLLEEKEKEKINAKQIQDQEKAEEQKSLLNIVVVQNQSKNMNEKKIVRIIEDRQSSNDLKKPSTSVVIGKKILKERKKYQSFQKSDSKQQNDNDDDYRLGTEYLLHLQQQQEEKRQKKAEISRYSKIAHNVISLIIDDVEKKIDVEGKSLQKLLFKQQGGNNGKYVDDDEQNYAKFMNNYTDLCRSTHLLKIKKELSEKQFAFEDFVQMRYQLSKKSLASPEKVDSYYYRLGNPVSVYQTK